MKFYTLLIFFIILNELILKGNIEPIFYSIKNYSLNKNMFVKQETPTHFIQFINNNLKKLVKYDNSFTLVDFGCGDGTTLQMLTICKNKIGIEIDKSIYNLALQNCKKCNIKFINDDILNYKFATNTILYMYEPLWLCKDYLSIYEKLFKTISNNKNKVYILYLTGLEKQLNQSNFEKFNLKLLYKYKNGSILLNRTLYIFSN